jgi:hypothetical protein
VSTKKELQLLSPNAGLHHALQAALLVSLRDWPRHRTCQEINMLKRELFK